MLSSFPANVLSASTLKAFTCFLVCAVMAFGIGLNEAQAQNRVEVTGTVIDATDGEPLPGATIIVQGSSEATGSTIGTTSLMDGTYSINVPENLNVLVVSFIGYITQEVEINGRTTVDIELEPDIRQLADVVVVGYGTQEEREITSAVASVDEERFNQGNVNDSAQLLQGKVAGLNVTNRGGNPNAGSTIRLRGLSTVGANTEPLIVIDGVIGADLANVDPSDIQSVDVLKDGSAAAIYGTRGSSGVILVTTKKGNYDTGDPEGNIRLDYNGYVSAAMVENQQPVMSATEYIEAGGNDLGSVTDWQDLVTRTGVSNVHNIAVSGGTGNTIYRVSTNFRDVNGVLEQSGFRQINARANITHNALDDRLTLTLNASTTRRDIDNSFEEALRYAVLYNPTAPVRFDNGEFFQAILFDNFNPVAIYEQNVNEGQRKAINYNVQAQFDPIENLSINANIARQFNSQSFGEFYPSTSFFRGLNRNGLARRYFEDRDFTLFETYASYNDTFIDRLDATITGGYSFQETFQEGLTIEMGNLPTNVQSYYGIDLSGDRVLGNPANVFLDSYATPDERIIAFFGRLNVTYDNGIFFNASFRREGSTKLGPENQWGSFPAFSIGTDISRFFDIDAITQMKIRLGYGVTGALPGPNGLAQDLYTYSFAGGGTVSKARDANPDLKWEEKTEINLGVDFGLFEDRLTGALDVYTRDIDDFILEIAVPTDQFPSGTQFQNAGRLRTYGLEFQVNYDAYQSQNVFWNTGIVFDTYSTELEEFIIDEQMRANLGSPGQNATNMIRVAVGEQIGQIWGPVFSGEVNPDGTPVFVDLNGDGQLITDQGNALSENGDFKQLGKGFPDFTLGWTNQVNYKNWELNAFFRGAFGHSLVNTYRAFYEPIDPGAINSYNRVITDKAVEGLTVSQFSSLYVEKADFVKLDNVTLAYNFDVSSIEAFRRIRAYVTLENAFTITNYTGIDPEPVLQDRGSTDNGGRISPFADVLSAGIDRRNNYFTARTLTFGLNIGF
ncbi:SusC/RagA family TonB-linked outer membrane protein [Rhodohalobacter mucosus]|nr:SusC/RagA family TonB-linked outer membrane protein [Rhodohalobacter mucosus]